MEKKMSVQQTTPSSKSEPDKYFFVNELYGSAVDSMTTFDETGVRGPTGASINNDVTDPFAPIADMDSIFDEKETFGESVLPRPLQQMASSIFDPGLFEQRLGMPVPNKMSFSYDQPIIATGILAEVLDDLEGISSDSVSNATTSLADALPKHFDFLFDSVQPKNIQSLPGNYTFDHALYTPKHQANENDVVSNLSKRRKAVHAEVLDDLGGIPWDRLPNITTSLADALLKQQLDEISCAGNMFAPSPPGNFACDHELYTTKRQANANNDISHASKRKKMRGQSDSEDSDDGRFRVYQAEKWTVKFEQLVAYKKKHGHCQVPHGYKENEILARWAKRQRYQYKLFNEGKASTITEERIVGLEELGFVWDSYSALWEERCNELKQYCMAFGHANVPSTFPPCPKLAIWVKCQRRQYKLLCAGEPSNMTLERIEQLNKLNFVWGVREAGS
jgi:hypothetical protein